MKIKHALNRIFHPGPLIVLLSTALSAVLLILIFTADLEGTALAYASYLLASYSLVVLILWIVTAFAPVKASVYAGIRKYAVGERYLDDRRFRAEASLYWGVLINALYVLLRAVAAWHLRTLWYAVVAFYYLALCLGRLYLIRSLFRARRMDADRDRDLFCWRRYCFCGGFLLLLGVAMSGMCTMMVMHGMHNEYEGNLIYLTAAYTFYLLWLSVSNVIRFRHMDAPLLLASKNIAMTGAFMSVFVLQAALVARFGEDQHRALILNSTTAAAVCAASLVIALVMVLRGRRKLRQIFRYGRQKEQRFYEQAPSPHSLFRKPNAARAFCFHS